MEDPSNRNRLTKLVRFHSSHDPAIQTSLSAYVERMKEKQSVIYYVAGTSRQEVERYGFGQGSLKENVLSSSINF